MIKVSDLIDDFADRFNQPIGTIKNIARYLREDGLLNTGARGVNAPDATYLDAARLLLALMANASAVKTPSKVKNLGALPAIGEGKIRDYQGWNNLESALAWLFKYVALNGLPEHNLVDLVLSHTGPAAYLTYRNHSENSELKDEEIYTFLPPNSCSDDNPSKPGLYLTTKVSPVDLEEIGRLFSNGTAEQ